MNNPTNLVPSLLESLVNHIALPPKLPTKQDHNIDQVEEVLVNRLKDASRTLRDLSQGDVSRRWERVRKLLQICKLVNVGSKLNKTSLLTEFRSLDSNDVLILHVNEQNAGLLIRRQYDDLCEKVIFEAFEASPTSEKVLAAENCLQWDFPGCAVAIPYSEFQNNSFQDSLAAFLEQSSTESVKRFAARTQKAGSSIFESRDTADPALITQMLMTMLEANGHPVFPPLLRKHVRDDVCWNDGAEIPWRRSSYWLVLRVGLERYLRTLYGSEVGRVYYKFLICVLLARLIDDTLYQISHDLLALLKGKLARRLSKLEVEKERATGCVPAVYELLFSIVGPLYHKTIKKTNEHIEAVWNQFKNVIRRPVPRLQQKANFNHLRLTLPQSGPYLQQILSSQLHTGTAPGYSAPYHLPMFVDVSAVTATPFSAFAKSYYSLSELETENRWAWTFATTSVDDYRELSIQLSVEIDDYLRNVKDAYNANPEQKSIMILTVMELWMWMDKCATSIFDLLLDYSPGFSHGILEVLQLPQLEDMSRLQDIEEHLKIRHDRCRFPDKNIFDNPSHGCFAERYFDDSKDSPGLHRLRQKIETEAENARVIKERDWLRLSAEFQQLEQGIAGSACIYTTDEKGATIHDGRRCTKCYLRRKARRMAIDIHEHPLPSHPAQAKAVVFELGCPKAYAAYRNATWRVLATLTHSGKMASSEPTFLLCDYSELRGFENAVNRTVSLASTTKSHLSTHYNRVRFPAGRDDVFRSNGLRYEYFDTLTKAWPGRQSQNRTFAHHCQILIPKNSPFSSLQVSANLALRSKGPTSNEIISSLTKCPARLNMHEFMAYQTLLLGKHQRWPSLLAELGSSNLNFSTEAVTLLIGQLAFEAGPAHNHDTLRAIHGIFRDESFCRTLIYQIEQRLAGISSNWRETNCMETLLHLTLRLSCIGPKPIIIEARKLIEKARSATIEWTRLLRTEIRRSADAETSEKCSRYAFWAAMLCRRTFFVHKGNGDIDRAALSCFIESSMILQETMPEDPSSLPPSQRNTLIRDLKMVHQMRFLLRSSLEAHPGTLEAAINAVWPQPEGEPRCYTEPEFLNSPNEWWVQSSVHATQHTRRQTIHYHLLEGHLLVDGQPLGKLPAEYRDSAVLRDLFGEQGLLTFPSGLPGMKYVLALVMNGHQIHLGFRNGKLIVRAAWKGTILELVPRTVFKDPLNSENFDLPDSLAGGNCVHWLDVYTGIMEIRRKPDIWIFKPGNWVLDFNTRRARRRNKTSLVDPHSVTFDRISKVFRLFERPEALTVFQPDRWNLSVELDRLELTFFVNPKHLLQCRQLLAEIDNNQDSGTWYGLRSQLVMRNMINPRQRSIIVPLGEVIYSRDGFHVSVSVKNLGEYGRFTINETLGRLECPIEPKLLYMKAQLHACTSFPVPDPLTGRTGTEEALHCLKSGYSQPWRSLSTEELQRLDSIANLTPGRDYYPKGLKNMQRVYWDPHLTITIQHDAFRPVIEEIYKRSQRLSSFELERGTHSLLKSQGEPHLSCRSSLRRHLYQRPNPDIGRDETASKLVYSSRGRRQSSIACNNVFQSVKIIRKWPSEIHTTTNLAGILQKWPNIGGFDQSFEGVLLSDYNSIEFGGQWGALVNMCRGSDAKDIYRLMFLFAIISFNKDITMDVVQTLLAYAIFRDLKSLEPPQWKLYDHFQHNQVPSLDFLVDLIKPCCTPYAGEELSPYQGNVSSRLRKELQAAERAHKDQAESNCKDLARWLLEQWPCLEPAIEGFPKPELLDESGALELVLPKWRALFQNMELSRYVEEVQTILNHHSTDANMELPGARIETQVILSSRCRGEELPDLSQHLLHNMTPREFIGYSLFQMQSNRQTRHIKDKEADIVIHPPKKENVPNMLQMGVEVLHTEPPIPCHVLELETIITGVTNSKSTVRQQYGLDLKQSLEALKQLKNLPKPSQESIPQVDLLAEISNAHRTVRERFDQLSDAFERNDSRAQWLKEGGLWPCITTVTLLEQLRSTCSFVFGEGMKESLVAYALSITTLQRLLRIEDADLLDNKQRLLEEQQNMGHSNWQPLTHPDWLLLEIDANMLIRHDQIEVAIATISPASGLNSVLQMNMGQGKTSCVMPMVSTFLADTAKLLRLIVPKALLLQTAQLLQARIGGLVGRRVIHVPFSRKTPTDHDIIKSFLDIHEEIMASSGVIVALPENILSFMLSGLQRLSDSRIPEAATMINIHQSWMREKCRDVLDECDFTLAVRTQLIYPSGSQTTVDGHPHRWEAAEAMLRLVEGHLWSLQQKFPRSIEVVRRPQGGFPLVFFLRGDVEDALITRLVGDILRGQTPLVPGDCTKSDRQAIKQFISDPIVKFPVIERVSRLFPDRPAVKQNLYLLRGLLVYRILLLTLKKRWNVQYGLHPDRDPIAVPFHAKGVPSEQAEWGHPDVAILLTTLSFYFGGLNLAQLRQSLEHVMKSDNPSNEYDRWTHSSKALPGSLREWNVINVDDEVQLAELWYHLRYSGVVIDHFLNNFVFPKHAKQFRTKLQASGWDIPLFSLGGQSSSGLPKTSRPLTTGFSGTNDNRTMMPLTIKQEDLPGLSHTNAEVLTYLLQPRNRTFVLAANARGRHISELDLLGMLKHKGIRMLIDAGAQILEMDNQSLVRAWLQVDHEAPAAVFFNSDNQAMILYRTGRSTTLSASPFAESLGDCLVYLDEAHTRGTDLKMPLNAKGALTLGLGQTKDHTVQAAMRLRQLATSQSVIFYAPPEVHQSILDVCKKTSSEVVDSSDVVCWLLEQTCSGIEQLQPLYYCQGIDFCHRTQAGLNNPRFLDDRDQRGAYLGAVQQNEQQTLEQLYKPKKRSNPTTASGPFSTEIAPLMEELNSRRKGFQDSRNTVHASALQEVEQEREVAFEVEAVREVQIPLGLSPVEFGGLHRDIKSFVGTGRLFAGYQGYEHIFNALRHTALGRKHGIRNENSTSKLFLSREFSRTVKMPQDRPNDNYLRDVRWILWSVVTDTALVIVPEEAELVFPLIRHTKNTPTHLLTYAAPVTRRMLHFNNLTYYAVPSLPTGWTPPTWLTIELGIFSGRLYFEFKEYADLRHYLGFIDKQDDTDLPEENSNEIILYNESLGPDGAASKEADEEETLDSTPRCAQSFTAQPLAFLQKWLAVRRKGQDFTQTPMGYVCQAKPLTADHAFFSKNEAKTEVDGPPNTTKAASLGLGGTKEDGDAEFDQDIDSEEDFFDYEGVGGQSVVNTGEGDNDSQLGSEQEQTPLDDEHYASAR